MQWALEAADSTQGTETIACFGGDYRDRLHGMDLGMPSAMDETCLTPKALHNREFRHAPIYFRNSSVIHQSGFRSRSDTAVLFAPRHPNHGTAAQGARAPDCYAGASAIYALGAAPHQPETCLGNSTRQVLTCLSRKRRVTNVLLPTDTWQFSRLQSRVRPTMPAGYAGSPA